MYTNSPAHSALSPLRADGSSVFLGASTATGLGTSRTVHEEATVEGVMNRWRVRPIYDNYSATVAPSAPDTMSVFLTLRADLLKSSLALDPNASSIGDAPDGGVAEQRRAKGLSSDEECGGSGREDGEGGAWGPGGGAASRTQSTLRESQLRKHQRAQQKKDDYTVRQLKGELARLLEQLQISNAEAVQLRNQIAGMTKELTSRQRRIGDLEEQNRHLSEQNSQLQQSVAELGLTVNTIEESNHAQLVHTRSAAALSVVGTDGGGGGSIPPNGGGVSSSVTAPTASSRQRGLSMRQASMLRQ